MAADVILWPLGLDGPNDVRLVDPTATAGGPPQSADGATADLALAATTASVSATTSAAGTTADLVLAGHDAAVSPGAVDAPAGTADLALAGHDGAVSNGSQLATGETAGLALAGTAASGLLVRTQPATAASTVAVTTWATATVEAACSATYSVEGEMYVGQTVRCRCTFTLDGAPFDPGTVRVRLRRPAGGRATSTVRYEYGTDAELEREDVGVYKVSVTLDRRGTVYGLWESTDADEMAAVEFSVNAAPWPS